MFHIFSCTTTEKRAVKAKIHPAVLSKSNLYGLLYNASCRLQHTELQSTEEGKFHNGEGSMCISALS
jgi:hypothetical protein